MRRIVSVDEKNHRVYFLANGREKGEDPYLTHLYSVGFDAQGLRLISPEPANHVASVSADGTFFVDSYSRVDLPGKSALRRAADGSEVRVLEQGDASELQKTGWKFPEPFEGKATDGTTDLYGVIWRPLISMRRRNIQWLNRSTPARRISLCPKHLAPRCVAPNSQWPNWASSW